MADLTAARVRALAIGFAPGLPYMGPLPEHWDIPRQTALTPVSPAGAVVVAVRQLIIFPAPTPTGWRQVARTGFRAFRPGAAAPFPLSAGDEVRFRAVDAAEFEALVAADPEGGGAVAGAGAMTALRVLSAGPGVTVQDLGRPGWLASGLSRGGAADRLALLEGAALLGQGADLAALGDGRDRRGFRGRGRHGDGADRGTDAGGVGGRAAQMERDPSDARGTAAGDWRGRGGGLRLPPRRGRVRGARSSWAAARPS